MTGSTCLDVGCGGGDATLELARRVAPRGRVIGVDIDEMKLEIARGRSRRTRRAKRGVSAVGYPGRVGPRPLGTFDVVYARFLLTHLSDPASVVTAFYTHLRPGGRIGLEDIDFSGYFTYPGVEGISALSRIVLRDGRASAAEIRTSDPDCRSC